MNKQIIFGSAFVMSMVLLPVAVQARRGADNPAGHVRQEDKVSPGKVQGVNTASAQNGVRDIATRPEQSTTTNVAQTNEGKMTKDEVIAIAMKQFPNKTYEKTEQESEEGLLVWSVHFTDGSRVDVSIDSGDITRIKDKSNDPNLVDDEDDDKSNDSGRNHTEDN